MVVLDEGISLSTISQRRMSATFERRLSSSLERRLSGSKTHLGHRAVDRVNLNLGQCDTCSESAWSEVYMNNDMESKEVGIQTSITDFPDSVVDKIEEEESDKVHILMKFHFASSLFCLFRNLNKFLEMCLNA